jgi:hypothetical protein
MQMHSSMNDAKAFAQVSCWVASKMEDIEPIEISNTFPIFGVIAVEHARNVECQILTMIGWSANIKHTYWCLEISMGRLCSRKTELLSILMELNHPMQSSISKTLALLSYEQISEKYSKIKWINRLLKFNSLGPKCLKSKYASEFKIIQKENKQK